jgi:hypothetical protein
MTAPITNEELARLEADIADGTILGLYCDRLIARLRAAEARAEKAERDLAAAEIAHAAFRDELDRQHVDCESKRETAERERDEAREASRLLGSSLYDDYARGRADERALRLGQRCVCGHERGLHEGHTQRPGDPEPTHCSQLCGCHAFRLARVSGGKGGA